MKDSQLYILSLLVFPLIFHTLNRIKPQLWEFSLNEGNNANVPGIKYIKRIYRVFLIFEPNFSIFENIKITGK
jgi:hypothetical protein